ncbi:MAG: hypothetical protein KKB50_09980 [Planctomycetes bacterium]|nr:hypothetical protein [Planctomycetota bacterium]
MPRGVPRKKITRKRAGRRAASKATPYGLGGAIASLSAHRGRLIAQRDELDNEIGAIDSALAAISGRPATVTRWSAARKPAATPKRKTARRAGARAPRKGSLKEHIAKVMQVRRGVMAVKDITAGVLKTGYKTKNKTLAKSVGTALTEMRNVTKIGRGKFRMEK